MTKDEIIQALRACTDKMCTKCPIGLKFGCARKLCQEAARLLQEGEEK